MGDSSPEMEAKSEPVTLGGCVQPDCALTLQLSDEADYPQPMSD